MDTLKELYIDQLQDIYSADRQSRDVTKKLVDAATNTDLRSALERGVDGIERGMATLEAIIKRHNAEPTGEFCKGMEGLVKEAKDHALNTDFTDDDVRDAMIITQYQRMTHYGLAGYGCLVAFANRLGLGEEAGKLQECLDRTYSGDREMTKLAQGGINHAAAA